MRLHMRNQMGDYRVTVVDSMSEWLALGELWNGVLQNSISDTVFLTYEWLSTWADCFLGRDRKLFILAVYDKSELVGAGPFYINSIRFGVFPLKQLEFLGLPEAGSDYLDVLAKKGKEKQVALCIYDFLFNEVSQLWDCLMLRDIPSNSLFLLHFSDRIRQEGKYAETTQGSFCPSVLLPKTEDELFSGLSANRRALFRRHLRMLGVEAELTHSSATVHEAGPDFDDFKSFCRANKAHCDDELLSFIEAFALKCGEKNWVQIDTLSSNGKSIAGLLHLRYGNELYMYIMATDKAFNPKVSVGNVLVGLCIKNAVNHGIHVYDFLKGAEDYKFSWSNCGRSSTRFLFCQKKLIPLLLMASRFMKYSAKMLLR